MKHLFYLFIFTGVFCVAPQSIAQTTTPTPKVGINTANPTEVLHVSGTMRVQTMPEKGNSNIYTRPDGSPSKRPDQPYMPTATVVTDYNGVLGRSQTPPSSFFYMPAVYLPTTPIQAKDPVTYTAATEVYSLDLYKEYKKQYDVAGTSAVKSPSATTLPTETSSYNLTYFVTYYDDTVYENVAISNSGILTYKVKQNALVTARSYMNIVLRLN